MWSGHISTNNRIVLGPYCMFGNNTDIQRLRTKTRVALVLGISSILKTVWLEIFVWEAGYHSCIDIALIWEINRDSSVDLHVQYCLSLSLPFSVRGCGCVFLCLCQYVAIYCKLKYKSCIGMTKEKVYVDFFIFYINTARDYPPIYLPVYLLICLFIFS